MGLKDFLGSLQDRVMFALIGRSIIYNVSWEDPRIDCELLDLHSDDTILMLTSGGCNVLDMILEGAKRVVAADLNPRQNALLELKKLCIKNLTYDQFFELFAKSNYKLFGEVYPRLRSQLSPFSQGFWDENKSFFKSVMWSGMSGVAALWMMRVCRMFGLGGLIDGACTGSARALPAPHPAPPPPSPEVKECPTLAAQREVYGRYEPKVYAVAAWINATKRLWCPLIAVPASQLHLFDGNIVKHTMDNLFLNTHIAKDNYFYYGYMYGGYTKECCPRYLREEHYETLRAGVDRIEVQTGTLQDVASRYPDGYFSRYILLDHMDWMPMSMVLDEWSVFVTKARSDCRILWRSFATHQHIVPLKYLDFHEDNVRAALRQYPDRVAMYNSTWLATIPKDTTIVARKEYRPPATVLQDLNVLWNMYFHPISGQTHEARLNSFYSGQATSYDVFRYRFLHGRVPMIEAMPTLVGATWLDIGGGTAANLEHFSEHIGKTNLFKKIIVLDLCKPLLDVADERIKQRGWGKVVKTLLADATDANAPGLPAPGSVDVITMSYSLTMIPDWNMALSNVRTLRRAAAPVSSHPAPLLPAGLPPPACWRLHRDLGLHGATGAQLGDAQILARCVCAGRHPADDGARGLAACHVPRGCVHRGDGRLPLPAPPQGAVLLLRGAEGVVGSVHKSFPLSA